MTQKAQGSQGSQAKHPAPRAVSALGQPELVPVNDLKPYEGNPRRISRKAVEQVAESIRLFGWQQPIVADADGVIIIGHTRWQAAKTVLREKQVPVIIDRKLSPDQVRALRVADNRTHDYTTWDYTQLAAELDGIGDDFAGVLDLADWQGIVSEFTAGKQEPKEPMITDDEAEAMLGGGYTCMVVFTSRDAAHKAGPALLEIPGVVNVRHPG